MNEDKMWGIIQLFSFLENRDAQSVILSFHYVVHLFSFFFLQKTLPCSILSQLNHFHRLLETVIVSVPNTIHRAQNSSKNIPEFQIKGAVSKHVPCDLQSAYI